MSELDKIRTLLQTGDENSIRLAMELAKSVPDAKPEIDGAVRFYTKNWVLFKRAGERYRRSYWEKIHFLRNHDCIDTFASECDEAARYCTVMDGLSIWVDAPSARLSEQWAGQNWSFLSIHDERPEATRGCFQLQSKFSNSNPLYIQQLLLHGVSMDSYVLDANAFAATEVLYLSRSVLPRASRWWEAMPALQHLTVLNDSRLEFPETPETLPAIHRLIADYSTLAQLPLLESVRSLQVLYGHTSDTLETHLPQFPYLAEYLPINPEP